MISAILTSIAIDLDLFLFVLNCFMITGSFLCPWTQRVAIYTEKWFFLQFRVESPNIPYNGFLEYILHFLQVLDNNQNQRISNKHSLHRIHILLIIHCLYIQYLYLNMHRLMMNCNLNLILHSFH